MYSLIAFIFAFNPRFPYVNSFLTYWNLPFTTMNSQFTYVNSSFTLVNWVMEYVNRQFMVVNFQFTYVRNLFTYGNRSLFSQFFLCSIKNGPESMKKNPERWYFPISLL